MSFASTYKPVFVFFGLATRRTHATKAAAAAAAAAEAALVAVRAATTRTTWPRSTPMTTETGDASRGRLSSDDPNRTISKIRLYRNL